MQLFNQNAASTSANFKMEEDIWKFTLSDGDKSENFLTVDLKRGTYISKRNNGKPQMGLCAEIKNPPKIRR